MSGTEATNRFQGKNEAVAIDPCFVEAPDMYGIMSQDREPRRTCGTVHSEVHENPR